MENTITETVAAPVQIRTADQEAPAIAGVSFLVLTKKAPTVKRQYLFLFITGFLRDKSLKQGLGRSPIINPSETPHYPRLNSVTLRNVTAELISPRKNTISQASSASGMSNALTTVSSLPSAFMLPVQ